MDMSPFADENEILLMDGTRFEVISVQKTATLQGQPLNLIVLKEGMYDMN